MFQARAWHAASAAQQGLSAEAKDAVLATLRLRPEFSISRFVRMVRLSDPQQGEKLAEGLRKAGLPE